jgi:hypothetical protein
MKYSYSFQLNYDITSEEKEQAEKALSAFEHVSKLLHKCEQHLDILYIPFKDHPEVTPEELVEHRASLRRFRDKVINNFNTFKKATFRCIQLMNYFSSDTQSSKLVKSVISTVEEIEKNINEFSELFTNLEDKDFVPEIVKTIDCVKKDIEQLEDIIDERIKSHILTNILGKTWVNSLQDELKVNIDERVPLLVELNEQRQKALNNLKKKNK